MTRFNLPTEGKEASLRNSPEWLKERFELFERYCLPSLAGQTNQDFKWIIYFDEATSREFRDRIKAAQRVRPFFAYFTDLFPSEGWRESVLAIVGADRRDALITTNLDNDDSLALNYVDRLREAATQAWNGRSTAINFHNGSVLRSGELYAHQHGSNAFTNLIEPYSDALKTAPAIRHMDVRYHMPVVQIFGDSAWLQVVHGKNVSNRVRGRRVARRHVEHLFPDGILQHVEMPNTISLFLDHFILYPIRSSRDCLLKVIRAGKRIFTR